MSSPTDAADAAHDLLLAHYTMLIGPIAQALPPGSEVVLHDLAKLPLSIIAVSGDVTGRQAGDSATNLLVDAVAANDYENKSGYDTWLPDGRKLRSSTTFLRDFDGTPIAALCINCDVSTWELLNDFSGRMLGKTSNLVPVMAPAPVWDTPAKVSPEIFFRDIHSLSDYFINQAIENSGVPVDLMQKRHKFAIVRDLQARNLFMLKSAVDIVAEALQTTRFTIYNYINEIAAEETPSSKGELEHMK